MKNSVIKTDVSQILDFIPCSSFQELQPHINNYQKHLLDKTGKGNDFLGWVDFPVLLSIHDINEIKATAKYLREIAEVIVVIGIGGSYLGSKAVIEALDHSFKHLKEEAKSPAILFAGQNISDDYHSDLLDILDNKDYAVVVISKSGTTTEPAIAFRLIKNHIIRKYGKENINKRIIAITDKERGALKTTAEHEGYKSFVIPDDVGGRYSVLTAVGLLPIAAAGYDIEKLIAGAKEMYELNKSDFSIENNPVSLYAAARYELYRKGYSIELMVNYHPKLVYLSEWWKQLYGESEGKEHKGLFPASVLFTTDLHSLGQYIQEGQRILFETILSVQNTSRQLHVPEFEDDIDGLNYLAGKTLQQINLIAEEATLMAHVQGQVPNIKITIPEIDEFILGQLIYFFEMACGLSGYLLDVNPFDQPGVEAYKNNMFRLLGKKGYV